MGAFPIQSDSACLEGWISRPGSGFGVPAENLDRIEAAIRRSLKDDRRVDRAAESNFRTIAENLDQKRHSRIARECYEQALAH